MLLSFNDASLGMQAEKEARSTEKLEKEQRGEGQEKPITKKSKNDEFIEQINQNYSKRVDEVEHFSKHLFNLCADLNSECLHGYLDTVQHLVELQKTYSGRFPVWFASNQVLGWMEQNNKAWTQIVENTDSMYTQFLNNCKDAIRMYNQNCQDCIQFFERNYEFAFKNLPKLED
jgi:hypothetical protein